MYSVINVDISGKTSDFLGNVVRFGNLTTLFEYNQYPIIRGSSTVNGDSAHSNETLSQEHNYVSFYVKSIKVRYDISFSVIENVTTRRYPGYVILFKFPYKNFNDLMSKFESGYGGDFILYSHPENVLAYDVYNFTPKGASTKVLSDPRFLNVNKPFVVGPNDYVGILYFFSSVVKGQVEATAKVTFKPQ